MDNFTRNRHFPSFPVPVDGETQYSLFTRCKKTSGFADDVILKTLTGQRLKSRLLGPLPAYLPTMAKAVHKNHPYSDPVQAVRKYSIFPYLSYFMPSSLRAVLQEKVASADVTQPIGLSMGLSKYPLNVSVPPRYCLSCIEEGIKAFGFQYFRREHQLPGVYYCWKHKEVLYHGCNQCGEYPIPNANLALAGECECSTGIKPLPTTSVEGAPPQSLLWLAEQSAFLLTSSGTRFSNPATAIGQKAISEARNRLGTVDYLSVASKVVDFFGEDVLRLLNVNVFSGDKAAPWIRRFFYEDRGNRSTIYYLLLVGAYFESVSDFELNASEEEVAKKSMPRKVANIDRLRLKHREILLQLVADGNDLSRSNIQKIAGGTYDFLIRHDKEFFQSQVKRAKLPKSTDSKRRERIDWTVLDTRKASELKDYFHKEYNKNEKPVFISKTSALSFCKIFQKYRTDPSHFPKVTEILFLNLEDRDSFHERRLVWALKELKRTGTIISENRLRRLAALEGKILKDNREFILSTIREIGGMVDMRSFLDE